MLARLKRFFRRLTRLSPAQFTAIYSGGKAEGQQIGYRAGLDAGRKLGYDAGRQESYSAGYEAGFAAARKEVAAALSHLLSN